jgi:hypothetical protein
MAKRKAGSQIANLTPDHKIGSLTFDHKKLGIDPTSMRASGVQFTIGKLSTRATTLL